MRQRLVMALKMLSRQLDLTFLIVPFDLCVYSDRFKILNTSTLSHRNSLSKVCSSYRHATPRETTDNPLCLESGSRVLIALVIPDSLFFCLLLLI